MLAKSTGVAQASRGELESLVEGLEDVDERLVGALEGLRRTGVEGKLRPGEDGGRSLLSFVQEGRVEEARVGARGVVEEGAGVVRGFEEVVGGLWEGLERVRGGLVGGERREGEGEGGSMMVGVLQEMDDRAQEMAVGLESLVSHFDLCVTAIRHVEGGNDAAKKIAGGGDLPDGVEVGGEVEALSEEDWGRMMDVLEEDAGQVDEVVGEIKEHILVIEGLEERVQEFVRGLEGELGEVVRAVKMLEEIGRGLPGFVSATRTFVLRWEEESRKIDKSLEELEGLREFCEEFARAYDVLLIEIGRRKAMEVRIEKEVEAAMKKIEKLYDDDLEEREAFRKEQGDFLPVDIWPGVMNPPLRYRVFAEEEVERVPDISKSVIHRAIKRVHGSQ